MIGSRFGNQSIADRTIIGLGIVAADPQLDPGKTVLGVLGQTEVRSIGSHGIDGGLEVSLLLSGERLESSLEGGGIIVTGEHVQEVLADDLGVDIHEQTMLAFRYEVPNVIIGLFAGAVIHKYLIEGLQGQIAFIGIGGGVVGVSPILGDKGIQNAGLDHLALDLVAILNEGHGKGAGRLQGVSGELLKDLVVLGLLPLEVQGIAGVDGLQVLDEQGQSALAAAGVTNAVEGLAVGLLDRFFRQLLKSHAFRFLNDLLDSGKLLVIGSGCRLLAAADHQGKDHDDSQQHRQCFFHCFSPPCFFF